ncbi:MAG: hypothetical protein U0869_10895 [Chloroflexota bacterium]
MRRTSFIAAVAMLVLTFAGAGAVSAHKGEPGHHGSPQNDVVSFQAHATPAVQGFNLLVMGKARHADPAKTLTAQAVIHFASGDVTVDLVPCAKAQSKHGVKAAGHGEGHGHGHHRHGRGNVLKAKVPVLADEQVGDITIDVTFTYDGVAQPVVTLTTSVVAPPVVDPAP